MSRWHKRQPHGLNERSRLFSAYNARCSRLLACSQRVTSLENTNVLLPLGCGGTISFNLHTHTYTSSYVAPARSCRYGLFEKRFSENTRHGGCAGSYGSSGADERTDASRYVSRLAESRLAAHYGERALACYIPSLIKSHDN